MKIKRRGKSLEDEVKSEANEPAGKKVPYRFDKVISTGSTLLDLSISGGRVRGGGIPGGVLVEMYGPSGGGKTSLLAELCASTQRKGGDVRFRDPESRLDKEYSEIHGMSIDEKFFDYDRPDTVKEFFDDLWGWKYNEGALNIFAGDSVAALSTELEMENEEGDKRGQKQAKEFSQNLRKTARKIGEKNILVAFSNQIRQGEHGEVTPGGNALAFYASLRLRVGQVELVEKELTLKSGKVIKKAMGIKSLCYVRKSTIDNPFRSAMIYIMFGYGIDDVRGNLQWYKDMMKGSVYDCFGKTYKSIQDAVRYVEEKSLEAKLRNKVIDLWEDIEKKFKVERRPKVRF